MSDLTERLRAPLENGYWEYGTRDLQRKAADRIDELEAALRDIVDGWPKNRVPATVADAARRALEADRNEGDEA